jgi:cobalamin-dependent methionine synthase I
MKTILCRRTREIIIETNGIAESINHTRRKKLVSALQEGNFEYVLDLARIQIDALADVLAVKCRISWR